MLNAVHRSHCHAVLRAEVVALWARKACQILLVKGLGLAVIPDGQPQGQQPEEPTSTSRRPTGRAREEANFCQGAALSVVSKALGFEVPVAVPPFDNERGLMR